MDLTELENYLVSAGADFEIISHNTPILSTTDAASVFDIKKAAPVFVMKTENGLVALILSSQRGRMDIKRLKTILGFDKFKMAGKEEISDKIGYQPGSIPLIGHSLQTIVDSVLLKYDYIYGGTGDAYCTLKINPYDVVKLNKEVRILDME